MINRFRAFTLVELLVVLAVVAILVALILPTIQGSLNRAATAKSINNLRQLVVANQSYAAENGEYVPANNSNDTRYWCAGKAKGKWDRSKGFLSPYLGNEKRVGLCPLLKNALKNSASFQLGAGGYGYNSSYIGGTPGAGYRESPDKERVPATPSQVFLPSQTIMFATCAYANGDSVQEYAFCEPPFWDFGEGPIGTRPSPSLHFRANGKALVAWCDGRVTAEAPEPRDVGDNPHGGDAQSQGLGWFGPDEENGYWNPRRSAASVSANLP